MSVLSAKSGSRKVMRQRGIKYWVRVVRMRILGIDPSGNFGREGFGVTGLCLLDTEAPKIERLVDTSASDFPDEIAYWQAVMGYVRVWGSISDFIVIEGYRLYAHKSDNQIQSELQTSQMIGAMKFTIAEQIETPYCIQFASEVKNRWKDDILVRKGFLEEGLKLRGERTNTHKRDALRHAIHFWRYGNHGEN